MTKITEDLLATLQDYLTGVETMLTCAVPGCTATQPTLQTGRLHLIDTPLEGSPGQSRKKYVWLCPACSETHVVQTWRAAGEQIQRRRPMPTLPFPVQPETVVDAGRPYLIAKRLA